MAPGYKGRRLVDHDGNIYVFECAMDVNAEQVEDILLSTKEGITKLVGYRLVIDGIYRDMLDQEILPQSKFNFYKKIVVFSQEQNVPLEDFAVTMTELIAKAKEFRIGKVRVTSWKGEPVFEDSRGYYLKRTVDCVMESCESKIDGVIRLSTDNEGVITRGQNFMPNDNKAQRAGKRRGWLCPTCAVKSIEVPQPELPIVGATPEVEPKGFEFIEPVPKNKTASTSSRKERIMNRLVELSDEKCEVSSDYLKGYISAAMEVLKGE